MYLPQPTPNQQVSNSSKVRNHVIVRNRVIEISDDDTDTEISPTPLSGSQTPTTGSGTTSGKSLHICSYVHLIHSTIQTQWS